jgi:alpha-amylase
MIHVMLCFHIHQPYRLGAVNLFDRRSDPFDMNMNRAILEKVSQSCYLPAGKLFLSLAERFGLDFKCSFSITGTAVEQLRMWNPDVLEQLQRLAASGCVEFIGETYHHSLFSHFDREEFVEQACMHAAMLQQEFSARSVVFRNTELLYEDSLSDYLSSLTQYRVLLVEDVVLHAATNDAACNIAESAPAHAADSASSGVPLRLLRSYNGLHVLLLRDYALSDDIAFRFAGTCDCGHNLTADAFALRLSRRADSLHGTGDATILLYVDYETLGEHYTEESGIFTFFRDLAEIILDSAHMRFSWPSDTLEPGLEQARTMSVVEPVSWTDSGKDLSAWLSSDLQKNAMSSLLELHADVKGRADSQTLEMARRLSSSDHFYYMYPWNGSADAEVHRHFSPYDSPEEAYMRYMAALAALEVRIS